VARVYQCYAYARERSDIKIDIWPKYQSIIVRSVDGRTVLDSMAWGVPIKLPGKREGTTFTIRTTNVRNLSSIFWRSMLANPAQRCLLPFSTFAEPKPSAGRDEVWFKITDASITALAGIWRLSVESPALDASASDPGANLSSYLGL